jgi:hypothetical protein
MDAEGGVRIVDGVIHIEHAEIEAGLQALAARWNVSVEDRLGITLRRALAEDGAEVKGMPTEPA